jgi:hypothetical protein
MPSLSGSRCEPARSSAAIEQRLHRNRSGAERGAQLELTTGRRREERCRAIERIGGDHRFEIERAGRQRTLPARRRVSREADIELRLLRGAARVIEHDEAAFIRGEQGELRRPGVRRIHARESRGDALDPSGRDAGHRVRKHRAEPDRGAPRDRGQLDERVIRERSRRHPEVERGHGPERREQRPGFDAERERRQLEQRGQRACSERRDPGDETRGGPGRRTHDDRLSTRCTELQEDDGCGRMMRDAGTEDGISDRAIGIWKKDDRLPDARGGRGRDHRRNGSHASSRLLSAPGRLGAGIDFRHAPRMSHARSRERELVKLNA